jgi:L-lactate dehydrogenase complex protein LldG
MTVPTTSHHTGSRETILSRIREALRLPAPPPHVIDRSVLGSGPASGHTTDEHVAAGPISLPILPAEAARPWLPDGGSTLDERLAILTSNLDKLRASVHRCRTPQHAAETLARLSRELSWQQVAWHDDALVVAAIAQLECSRYRVDTTAGCDKKRLEACDAGITACESLVAQTGSILVDSRRCGGRGVSILPHAHVVVATRDQIVSTLGDALSATKARHDGQLPSMLSFITGPSRTGDIERILVLGAHGPKELHVLLIDEPPQPTR